MLKRRGTTTNISTIWIHFTRCLVVRDSTKSCIVWLQILSSTLNMWLCLNTSLKCTKAHENQANHLHFIMVFVKCAKRIIWAPKLPKLMGGGGGGGGKEMKNLNWFLKAYISQSHCSNLICGVLKVEGMCSTKMIPIQRGSTELCTYAWKLRFVSSCKMYSQCGIPAFLAALHTTVCLDKHMRDIIIFLYPLLATQQSASTLII